MSKGATLVMDTSQFNRGAQMLVDVARRSARDIVNQAALDVSGRAFDNLAPSDPQAKRTEIKKHLEAEISVPVRKIKTGPNAGKIVRDNRRRALQRVHLLVNFYRGKSKKRGLYGEGMKRAAGRMKKKRQVGVGYLKSVFLPIIRMLNPLCKFKFPYSKTHSISRWPGSRGFGIAQPAQRGAHPLVLLKIGVKVRNPQDAKVNKMMQKAFQEALDWKAGKMQREAERIMDEALQSAMDRTGLAAAA